MLLGSHTHTHNRPASLWHACKRESSVFFLCFDSLRVSFRFSSSAVAFILSTTSAMLALRSAPCKGVQKSQRVATATNVSHWRTRSQSGAGSHGPALEYSQGKVSWGGLGRLNHVAIAVPNLQEAIHLYRDILGAKVSQPVVCQTLFLSGAHLIQKHAHSPHHTRHHPHTNKRFIGSKGTRCDHCLH